MLNYDQQPLSLFNHKPNKRKKYVDKLFLKLAKERTNKCGIVLVKQYVIVRMVACIGAGFCKEMIKLSVV